MAKDSDKVTLSDKQVLEFARVLGPAIQAEHLKLFDSDLAEKIAQAREVVDREDATAAAVALAAGKMLSSGGRTKELMVVDQQAEWLRCTVMQLAGLPYTVDLDLDGESKLVTMALGPSLASAGGALIPTDFHAEIEKRANEPVVIWPLLTKRPTRRESVTKPEITAYPAANKGAASKAGSTTSSDEITETPPTFSELTWTMRYFDARLIVKLDQFDDSPLSIYEELMEVIVDAFVLEREREPIIGTGSASSRPEGILVNASIETVAVDAAWTFQKLLDLLAELPQRYRVAGRATCVMGSQAFFDLVADLAANVRSAQFLLGVLPRMVESAYVTDGKAIMGDMRRYKLYHNMLMRIVSAIVPGKFARDIVVVEKWDGQVTVPDAFRVATGITYT